MPALSLAGTATETWELSYLIVPLGFCKWHKNYSKSNKITTEHILFCIPFHSQGLMDQLCQLRLAAVISREFRDVLLGKFTLEQQHRDLSRDHKPCGVHLGTGVSPLLGDT